MTISTVDQDRTRVGRYIARLLRKHSWMLPSLLLIGIVAALFPYEWLGLHWAPAEDILRVMFPGAWQHAAGHTTIFVGLGILLLITLSARWRPIQRYLLIILLLAFGQEALQLVWKGRGIAFDDVRDVATDLSGALLAWGLVRVYQHRK